MICPFCKIDMTTLKVDDSNQACIKPDIMPVSQSQGIIVTGPRIILTMMRCNTCRFVAFLHPV